MADIADVKTAPLMDSIIELRKQVFGLQLLESVDVKALDSDGFNFWVGLLHDCVCFIDQYSLDVQNHGGHLQEQIREVRSGSTAKL